jgi:hypothetical protein
MSTKTNSVLISLFQNRSSLQTRGIAELSEVCVRTMYLQVGGKFLQQNSGMTVGSSHSPVISITFKEHLKQLALDSLPHKPAMWLRYVENTSVVWPNDTKKLQKFLLHISSLRSTEQFTMQTEISNVLLQRNGSLINQKFNTPPPHTHTHTHWLLSPFKFQQPFSH